MGEWQTVFEGSIFSYVFIITVIVVQLLVISDNSATLLCPTKSFITVIVLPYFLCLYTTALFRLLLHVSILRVGSVPLGEPVVIAGGVICRPDALLVIKTSSLSFS